jgi:hypothetical protein
MRLLRNARVTAQRTEVPVFVCVQEKAMKDAWCLVSSRSEWTGSEIKRSYGKRFSVEETFRDLNNPRLGLALKQTVITRNDRRDVLFLLGTLAHALLTRLGKAGPTGAAALGPAAPDARGSTAGAHDPLR